MVAYYNINYWQGRSGETLFWRVPVLVYVGNYSNSIEKYFSKNKKIKNSGRVFRIHSQSVCIYKIKKILIFKYISCLVEVHVV